MKKTKFGIFLGLIVPFLCLAQIDLNQWKYYKEIEGGTGEALKFVLDDEIFSGSRKDLGDLRVVDQEGSEVSYEIILSEEDSGKVYSEARLVNNSYIPGQYSTAILDMGERGKIINNLTISTTSENFQRNIRVYGSDDMSSWQTILDNGYIYDYTDRKGNFKSQNTRVSFTDSIFRFIKVEISDDSNNPVKINSVAAKRNITKRPKVSERKISFETGDNSEKKTTEIIADLGIDGLPINKVHFEVANSGNFNRGLNIFSSSDKEKWQYISQGYIFRYNTSKFSGANLEVSFPENKNRYLKIEILNNDNASLDFSGISASTVWREVVFPNEKKDDSRKYRVFYGNPKAASPKYDLSKYIQYLNTSGVSYSEISSQKNNPSFVPEKEPEKPLSERIPYLFPTVLSLSSLLLIFLVYRFFRK